MRKARLLVLRRLVEAPLRSLTTTLAIAAGIALAVSIAVLLGSIDHSLDAFGQRLAGPAELRVTGATLRGDLPLEAVDAAATVPGVAAVAPMIEEVAPTQAGAGAAPQPTLVLGVDCRAEAIVGAFGCDPAVLATRTTPLAMGPGVAGGESAVLRTDLGRLVLTGVPVVPQLADLADGRVVVMPLALAQARYNRPAEVDTAYVSLAAGADPDVVQGALQARLGDQLPVLRGDAPPAGATAVLGAALPIYSLLGIFALGIGAVLVANTASMSLEARRRELAVIGALGGRPRTLIGAAVAEASLLGTVGGLLGSAGGALVAAPIVRSMSSFTEDVAGIPLSVHLSAGNVVLGVVLGTALGAAAAYVPARRIGRMDIAMELAGRDPGSAVTPARLGRRIALWGALAALGVVGCWAAPRGGGLAPWQAAIVTPSFLAVALGTLFAMAAAAPLALGHMGRVTASSPWAPLRLSVAAARRDHRRTGLLAVTVAAAIVTAFVTEGTSASAREEIESGFRRSGAGVNISTLPSEGDFGPEVPSALIAAAEEIEGVRAVHVGRWLLAGSGDDLVSVQSQTANRLDTEVVDGVADPERLAAGEVLIGTGLARRQHIRAGDKVRLATAQGSIELPVQGVWEEGNNVGSNVTMSPELMDDLYGPQPARYVSLEPASGVSEAQLIERIRAAGLDPELQTYTSMEVADEIADEVDSQFASFRVMQRALLAVLFVAVLTSLLLAGVHRRRELGLLGAVGADPRGLARMLLVEAAIVAGVGVGASVVIGPLMAWALNQLLPFVVGFFDPLRFAWSSLATSSLLAVAVAVAGAAWPAVRAARVEVLDALREE